MEKKNKAKLIWMIGIGVFALIGIASFIVGYGLRDGWQAVLAWFTSRWAYIVYVGALIYLTVVLCFVHFMNIHKETK